MPSSEPNKDLPEVPQVPKTPPVPSGVAKVAVEAEEAVAANFASEQSPEGVLKSPWLWAGVALGVLVLAAGVWWLWKKKKLRQLNPAPAIKGPDLYSEWQAFRAQLPRRLRRVLDEFQPVIVLGTVSGEKERIVAQLSGVDRNEHQYPKQVVFKGELLEISLGARCVVISPSEQFLASPSSSSDASWKKVLRCVSRVHAPRVLVCIAQGAMESSELDRLRLWSAQLRAHIDTVCDVRRANIEVEVAIAQSPLPAVTGRSATARPTDAFFELLSALSGDPRYQRLLNIPLAGIEKSLGQGEEQRTEGAQRWLAERLVDCRRGWPRLLSLPNQSAADMLRLAALFEKFDQLTQSVGVVLAELFVAQPGQARSGQGQAIRVLPIRDGRLLGTMPIFERSPTPGSERWYPTLPLVHRLGIATGTGLMALGLLAWYFHDRGQWLDAVDIVRYYQPTKPGHRFPLVEQYFTNAAGPLGFFDRDRLRCRVVNSVRGYLEPKIALALRGSDAPERTLQLVSLYVTGAPNDCDIDEKSAAYPNYQNLSDTIVTHIGQWRQTTGLTDSEIRTYLTFACPKTDAPMDMLSEFARNSQYARWAPAPDLQEFAESLESLTGQCPLSAADRDAVGRAEAIARAISDMEDDHSAALGVLEAIGRLDTPVMDRLAEVFGAYRARLAQLRELGNHSEEVATLVRDMLPYEDSATRFSPGGESALRAFKGRLDANLGELKAKRYKLRLSTASRTFVIDRLRLRKVLQLRALERLEGKLVSTVRAQEDLHHTPEVLFFTPHEYNRSVEWIGAGSWPSGVSMNNRVPWRYTVDGFKSAIQGPLMELAEAQRGSLCDEPQGDAQQLVMEFVRKRLTDYLGAYSLTWRDVYDSFHLRALPEEQLGRTLRALAQPSSPLIALVQRTAGEVNLPVDEAFPFGDDLHLAVEGLDTLASAAEQKAIAGYATLLQELANDVQADPLPRPPAKEGPPDPAASLDSFAAGLSPYGFVAWGGLLDPDRSVRGKFRKWAEEALLTRSLQRPLIEPFLTAHSAGVRDLDRKLAVWWKPFEQRLAAEVLGQFPFARKAEHDAEVLKVSEWLHPLDGRLVNEIQPIFQTIAACTEAPCPSLPKNAQAMLRDLTRIQQALFDEKGGARKLVFEVEPRPFVAQALSPAGAVISANGTDLKYFNTRPDSVMLEVPWNEAYVSALSVEVVGAPKSVPPATFETDKSPWSFLRLLAKGAPMEGARHTWTLQTNDPALAADLQVSYDICGGVTACDGLFSGVFKWR